MTPDDVTRLFYHMRWADALVLESLERVSTPPERAVRIYAHVLGAELVWIDRIDGVAQGTAVWPDADVSACRALAATVRARYERYLDALTPGELVRSAHYTNSAGTAFDTPVFEILTHVALHGAYHRGQVAMLVRDAGAEPNPTDYIAFVRGAPAATRRDAERRSRDG